MPVVLGGLQIISGRSHPSRLQRNHPSTVPQMQWIVSKDCRSYLSRTEGGIMTTTAPTQDPELQQELLSMAVWDKPFLDAVGDVISQDDFRPLSKGQDTFS